MRSLSVRMSGHEIRHTPRMEDPKERIIDEEACSDHRDHRLACSNCKRARGSASPACQARCRHRGGGGHPPCRSRCRRHRDRSPHSWAGLLLCTDAVVLRRRPGHSALPRLSAPLVVIEGWLAAIAASHLAISSCRHLILSPCHLVALSSCRLVILLWASTSCRAGHGQDRGG